jgi:hypothetical protein
MNYGPSVFLCSLVNIHYKTMVDIFYGYKYHYQRIKRLNKYT